MTTNKDDPFSLNTLPNGWWIVEWNKRMWNGIYTLASHKKLLELVFHELGCSEVGVSIRKNSWVVYDSNTSDNDIIYIKSEACLDDKGITAVAECNLFPNVLDGVCFPTQQEAERMLKWLEEKYLIRLLKANYGDSP